MKNIFKGAIIALALAGGSLVSGLPAMAADHVTIAAGPGGIAFGYADGYWDRGHNWHAWRNRAEAAKWREANREHYFDRKHEAEREHGWRESDRYWEHR